MFGPVFSHFLKSLEQVASIQFLITSLGSAHFGYCHKGESSLYAAKLQGDIFPTVFVLQDFFNDLV